MKTIRVYQLTHLSPSLFRRLKEAQLEAAAVWNLCMETHRDARWPGRNDLQRAAKGRYALHSRSVQMIVHAFLANVQATRKLRRQHLEMHVQYPLYLPSPCLPTVGPAPWSGTPVLNCTSASR
jgi:putative transposase